MDPNTLHFDAIVIDAHCDTLGDVLEGTRTLTERSDKGHVDLPRLKAGGVTAQTLRLLRAGRGVSSQRDPPRHAAAGHAHQAIESHP